MGRQRRREDEVEVRVKCLLGTGDWPPIYSSRLSRKVVLDPVTCQALNRGYPRIFTVDVGALVLRLRAGMRCDSPTALVRALELYGQIGGGASDSLVMSHRRLGRYRSS